MAAVLTGVELLRALQSGRGAHPTAASSKVGVESLDFEAMLKRVKAEGFHSGLGVTIAPEAGVQLSDDQLQRVAAAADVAQAHGVNRALVTIDGMNLMLDVGVRSITGKVDIQPGVPVTGVDAVMRVPDSASSAGSAAGNATGDKLGAILSASPLSRTLPLKNPSLLAALSKSSAA